MNLIAEDASPSREEVYQALVRSLRRRKGFGIVFVQCSPAEARKIIQDLQEDLPQKQTASLSFDKPIDNLYDIVDELPNRENLNILFIQGLEESLEPYIQPGYSGDGDYYNLNTVPTILSHLNQRRELFRDHFYNICFVFFLPLFAIKYIIRRSPDLFDWSAGVFEFPSEADTIYFKKGNSLFDLEKYEEAINLYDKVLQIQPSAPITWLFRGMSLKELGRYEEAIVSLENSLHIQIYNPIAWLNRGVSLERFGKYEEAIVSLDNALKIQPNNHDAWNNRGIALMKLGRTEEAITSFDEALKVEPNSHIAWTNKAASLGQLGRYEEALISANKAFEIQPEYSSAWLIHATTLNELGRYEEAIISIEKALEAQSDGHVWCIRGIILRNLGRYKESVESFEKSLESFEKSLNIRQDYDEVHRIYSITLLDLGRYEEAIVSLDKILEIEPDDYVIWQIRAYPLVMLGRYKEAINSYKKALEICREINLRKDEADVLEKLAAMYQALGEVEVARQYCQQALALATELGIPLAAECEALLLEIESDDKKED